MIRHFRALACAAALCFAFPPSYAQEPSSVRPMTLAEAYSLSLAHMETIAQDQQAAKQALARVRELVGDVLPQIGITASMLWEESPQNGIIGVNLSRQPLVALTLNQELFSGFREFLAFKQGKSQYQAANMNEHRAEELLYQDVGQAYINLLQAQDQIKIDEEIVKAGQDQVDFLRHWVQIGRAKESDLLSARSVLELAKAQLEQARQSEGVAQELLKFLTNLDQDLLPQELAVPQLGDLKDWLAAAENRSDVESARDAYESARLQAKIVSRSRWPTVTATGDYYLVQSAFSQNVHYAGGLSLTMPIFTGGVITAQTNEAKAQENSAEEGLSLALRTAEENTRSSYRNLYWALDSADAFKDAVLAAQKGFAAEKEDFAQNLVTNLDVLSGLTTMANTEVQSNAAKQQAAFGLIELEVAAGKIPNMGDLR